MKDIPDIQDQLATARNFVECAYMAAHDLPAEHANPLAAVLNAASDHLGAVEKALEEMKGGTA